MNTWGCTFNQADSDALARALQKAGHSLSGEAAADAVVYNTCSVKHATEQKILHAVKQQKKPLVVTGCLAQATPELVLKADPRASLLGIPAQRKLAAAVEATAKGRRVKWLAGKRSRLTASVSGVTARVRITEGCLGACSYCITRVARPGLQSFPLTDVRRVVEESVAAGAKEIQLCAQDTGCYGFDSGSSLPELLDAVCSVPGTFFVRVGMTNPQHVSPALLKAFEHPKIYKFLHVPVQSGSDSVLKAMQRPYTVKKFKGIAKTFKKKFPFGSLATDVIVGYPTESKKDFRKTLDLLNAVNPDVVNVSRFSPRPRTPAARLKKLPTQELKRRSRQASALAKKISLENNERFVGKAFQALVVEKGKAGKGVVARTLGYKPVVLKKARLGEFCGVRVTSAAASHLFGEKA